MRHSREKESSQRNHHIERGRRRIYDKTNFNLYSYQFVCDIDQLEAGPLLHLCVPCLPTVASPVPARKFLCCCTPLIYLTITYTKTRILHCITAFILIILKTHLSHSKACKTPPLFPHSLLHTLLVCVYVCVCV